MTVPYVNSHLYKIENKILNFILSSIFIFSFTYFLDIWFGFCLNINYGLNKNIIWNLNTLNFKYGKNIFFENIMRFISYLFLMLSCLFLIKYFLLDETIFIFRKILKIPNFGFKTKARATQMRCR